MTCLPVRGDTPSALTSGLSYVVDKHFITIFTTYISVDPAHHDIVRAKFGKLVRVVQRTIKVTK